MAKRGKGAERITIKTVAQEAGVSIGTVSGVLNGARQCRAGHPRSRGGGDGALGL